MKVSGIYKIESKIKPERIYVGSSIDIKNRWKGHLHRLRKGIHHSLKLQRHYLKHGESDLILIIIEPCFPEFLVVREQYYIDLIKPYFNVCQIAGMTLGYKHTEKTKAKFKNRIPHNKGKQMSEEQKIEISKAHKGKKREPFSDVTKNNMSKGHIGLRHSEETKNKMRHPHKKLA